MFKFTKADPLGYRWQADTVGYVVSYGGVDLGVVLCVKVEGKRYWAPKTKNPSAKKRLFFTRPEVARYLLARKNKKSQKGKELPVELL